MVFSIPCPETMHHHILPVSTIRIIYNKYTNITAGKQKKAG